MSVLPQDTVLGPLEVIDVFDVYDFPRLLLAQSPFGTRYLVLSVHESAEKLTWLYLPVTETRLAELQLGRLTLRTAFGEPEGALVEITTLANGRNELRTIRDVPPDWLPEEGELLRPGELVQAVLEPAHELARKRWRDVVQVALSFPRFAGISAPLRPLGEFLSNFQQTVDTFGAALLGHTAARGSIPAEILERTQLQLTETFVGSFGATLSTVSQADLFGASIAGYSMEELLRTVALATNRDDFISAIRDHGPRVANRFRVLLETLDSSTATAAIAWAPPVPARGASAFLGRETVGRTLAALTSLELGEAEALRLTCRLIGVNIRTKSYEVRSEADDRKYSGRVADDALSDVSHATINDRYVATLRVLIDVNTSTGEERTRFLLTSLRPL